MGWSDYWTKLTAGFIAGTEPDVFANHISRFAQFVNLGVLQPLDELPEFQNFNEDQYQLNLAKNWVGQDGHRYGTPKDWDTVALFYNKKMLADAGYTPEDLANAAWNPTDGGSFEKILARLSIDTAGVRGDEPGFNPKSVKTYGLATNDAGSFDGQTQWSPFAASNGWTYTDVSPWGRHYNYDQPAFQDTMSWYFGLANKGYFAPFTVFSDSNGPDQQLGSGSAALSMNGSWMASTYYGLQGIEVGVAPTPSGPIGHPMTMQNGLADSITTNATTRRGPRSGWPTSRRRNASRKSVRQAWCSPRTRPAPRRPSRRSGPRGSRWTRSPGRWTRGRPSPSPSPTTPPMSTP